jgi:hypothetical protein
MRDNRSHFLVPVLAGLVLLLSSCQLQLNVTVRTDGSSEWSAKFLTTSEVVFEEYRKSAQQAINEARAKGRRMDLKTGKEGSYYYVTITQVFSHIEELHQELNSSSPGSYAFLAPLGNGGHRFEVGLGTSSYPSLVPIELTIHVPGRITNASPIMEIQGSTARWSGTVLPSRGEFYVEFQPASLADSLPILIMVVVVLGLLGFLSILLLAKGKPSQRVMAPTPSRNRFCTRCGATLRPGTVFCPQCGAKLND